MLSWARTLAPFAVALCLVAGALADGEGPTLLPGDSATIVGTKMACLATTQAIRCGRTGGLAVTLSGSGAVRVTRAGRPVIPAGGRHQRLRLGVNGGFFVAGQPIYCHVYLQSVKTLDCATITPKGGIPNSHGFDLSDRTLAVFRYGRTNDRHVVRTYRMP
jgi:hypothetical protein